MGSGLIWVRQLEPLGLHLTMAGCLEAPLFLRLWICYPPRLQLQGRTGESGVGLHHAERSSPQHWMEAQSFAIFYTHYHYTRNSHSLEKNDKIQTNRHFLVVQQVKGQVSSLLWCGFHPWSKNFHMQMQLKTKPEKKGLNVPPNLPSRDNPTMNI